MIIKKVPQRKCLGCNAMKEKKELIKVVCNKEGEAFVDKTGKLPGRGAYVCNNQICLSKAQKARRFERALDKNDLSDIYAVLLEIIRNSKDD